MINLKDACTAYAVTRDSDFAEHWDTFEVFQRGFKAEFPELIDRSCFDFGAGPGWWGPLRECFSGMQELLVEYPEFLIKIKQVKEKFGGLRVYYHVCHKNNDPMVWPGDEEEWKASGNVRTPAELYDKLRGLVVVAEAACSTRCEVCGDLGRHSTNASWIRTLCEAHEYAQHC